MFFDREEAEDHGSAAYINAVGPENISAAVILDMWSLYKVAKRWVWLHEM